MRREIPKFALVPIVFLLLATVSIFAQAAERPRRSQAASQQDADKEAQQEAKKAKKEATIEETNELPAVLWRDPGNIASLDLLDGAGGATDAPDPNADYRFEKEDMNGSSPKFYARDSNGVEWLVKSGVEAKSETAATRLVWAMGYFTDEDYHLPKIHVIGLPKLHRRIPGASAETGIVPNVRLKRQGPGMKKVENWNWVNNPFFGTREFNGLVAMMALINNWDLKDPNNKVYVLDGQRHYLVSDLGAAFGKTGIPGKPSPFNILHLATKNSLKDYEHSKFVRKVNANSVALEMHIVALPWLELFHPRFYSTYSQAGRLENDIPLADVQWIAGELAQLRPAQIRDAFRAAGYSNKRVERFSKVVERRIADLKRLQDRRTERASNGQTHGVVSAP